MSTRSIELQQLIEDLKTDPPRSQLIVQENSRLIIVVEDTEDRYEFTGEEAKLLLANRNNVEALFDALGYPDETLIEIHNLAIDEDMVAELESYAATVDVVSSTPTPKQIKKVNK